MATRPLPCDSPAVSTRSMADMIGGCEGGPGTGPPSRPATAPPVGGSPGLGRIGRVNLYFCGVTQSEKDSSPNRNDAQLPDVDTSWNRSFGPKVSPSRTV